MTTDAQTHTPGPWTCDRNTLQVFWEDVSICEVHDRGVLETAANGRLIAAAPDLLAACQQMIEFCSEVSIEEWSGNLEFEQMRDAIAKATGR